MDTDTFPGLQADMLSVIRQCNAIILLARRVRSDAQSGQPEGMHRDLVEMQALTEKLHDFVSVCADTTDHLPGAA